MSFTHSFRHAFALTVHGGTLLIALTLIGCGSTSRNVTVERAPDGLETQIVRLIETHPIQREGALGKYWDERGFWAELRRTVNDGKEAWVLCGQVQGVNRAFIEVSKVTFVADTQTIEVPVSPLGQNIKDIAKSASLWTEGFMGVVSRDFCARLSQAQEVSIRVIGANDSTSSYKLSSNAQTGIDTLASTSLPTGH